MSELLVPGVGTQPLPPESYPRLDDPLLTVNEFVVTGKTVSGGAFCGATRITDTLPPAVGSCADLGK